MTGRAPFPQSFPIDADGGLWCEISPGDFTGRPALFLDRDGVIVEDTHYLGRPEDIRMLPGAADAIARCNRLRIPIVMVSNQSGIARGLYEWEGFRAVQAAVAAALAAAGGHLDAVLACAYHGDGRAPLNVADHPWRKPNPGMILAAGQRMKLDLPRSFIVGDRAIDLVAGRNARLRGGILVAANAGDPEYDAAERLAADGFAVEWAGSLADAVAALISRHNLGAGAPRPDARGHFGGG
jgi:D-glycero-D-manno-heptose 1,7-bisphosphate phosphatase